MQAKIFWATFIFLSLVVDFWLPFFWGMIATVPIILLSWWVAYRSDWF